MITKNQADALAFHLADTYDFKILDHDHPAIEGVFVALKALCALVPVAGVLAIKELEKLEASREHVTMTLPVPWGGAVVLLSKHAKDNPDTYANIISHEAEHARIVKALGTWQSTVDYVASTEMRAAREAPAYSIGAWVEYLLTGKVPNLSGPTASLTSSTYHLPAEDSELALNIVRSNLETMKAGTCPPLSVAKEVYFWLKQNAPMSIVATVRIV